MFLRWSVLPLAFLAFSLLFNTGCIQPTQNDDGSDTLFISYIPRNDTLFIYSKDTVFKLDTIVDTHLDTLVKIDSIFILDTLFLKDTMFSHDTVYGENNRKIHVFTGVLSENTNYVTFSNDSTAWIITLPISIDPNWISITYFGASGTWDSWISADNFQSSVPGNRITLDYRTTGIRINDQYKELVNFDWKVILLE